MLLIVGVHERSLSPAPNASCLHTHNPSENPTAFVDGADCIIFCMPVKIPQCLKLPLQLAHSLLQLPDGANSKLTDFILAGSVSVSNNWCTSATTVISLHPVFIAHCTSLYVTLRKTIQNH